MYLGKEMRDLAKQLLIVCFQGICIPPKLGKVSSPARASADSILHPRRTPSPRAALPIHRPLRTRTPQCASPQGTNHRTLRARSLSRAARAPRARAYPICDALARLRSAIPRAWNPARSHSHVPARIGPNVPFPVPPPPIRVQARERWAITPTPPRGIGNLISFARANNVWLGDRRMSRVVGVDADAQCVTRAGPELALAGQAGRPPPPVHACRISNTRTLAPLFARTRRTFSLLSRVVYHLYHQYTGLIYMQKYARRPSKLRRGRSLARLAQIFTI